MIRTLTSTKSKIVITKNTKFKTASNSSMLRTNPLPVDHDVLG